MPILALIGLLCTSMHIKNDTVIYFEKFCVAHIPKEIKKFICIKNIASSTHRILAHDSILYGYFCSGFVAFLLK